MRVGERELSSGRFAAGWGIRQLVAGTIAALPLDLNANLYFSQISYRKGSI